LFKCDAPSPYLCPPTLMRTIFCAVLVVAVAACVSSPDRLSESIYNHEQRAVALEAQGQYTAAEGQRRLAQEKRVKMARVGKAWTPPSPLPAM
jgi:hypothetical protein